jgi:hypothetical protein
MNRAIDTLFYNWVVTEDEKRVPTIHEDISDMEDADKIDVLMTGYAEHVAQLIEAEIISRAVVDMKVQQVQEDEELSDEDPELIAQAIDEDEDVMSAQYAVDEASNALNLLHTSMVKVFAREV